MARMIAHQHRILIGGHVPPLLEEDDSPQKIARIAKKGWIEEITRKERKGAKFIKK